MGQAARSDSTIGNSSTGEVLIEDTSLLTFYGKLTTSERRTLWACMAGWTLDGMDFMIYPLVIGAIMAVWHIDASAAGLAVTVTLLSSAVGGWLAGFVSDRVGRVRTLQFTILWFSTFTVICALAQSFNQLLIARAILGIGYGGEWTAGAVLMGEAIRAQYRGRAVGVVQSCFALGWGIAVIAQALIFSYIPPETAWRAMFLIGAVPALFTFFLRRWVPEPAISQQSAARRATSSSRPGIFAIFAKPILKTTILASFVTTGCQGGYYALTIWLPHFLVAEKHLPIVASTGYLATLILGSFTGQLAGAWLSDAIGRRRLFLVFSLGAIAVVLTYTQLSLPNSILWALGYPLGFFAGGYFSGIGPFLTELFPTSIRGSGQGFCYNFGRALGALFPFMVGYMSSVTSVANAIAIFSAGAYAIFFLAAYALPETRGRILHAD